MGGLGSSKCKSTSCGCSAFAGCYRQQHLGNIQLNSQNEVKGRCRNELSTES